MVCSLTLENPLPETNMTLQEAYAKWDEREALLMEADCECENGHDGAADRLIAEAQKLEKEMEAGGWPPRKLIREKRPTP